jgi:MFS family permease
VKFITKTILFLSLISLFTDVASEMLYPIMPMYLKSIGFSVVLIGILEGLAEATAGISKGYFGKLSDHLGRRRPFVQIGYALSAISKPAMALFIQPVWVFIARTADRLGKGVRTAARDAMLSGETTPEFKGRVFGLHRGFDTLGAALGPALALVYLTFHPDEYRTLFLLAFIPGVLAVALTLLIREKPRASVSSQEHSQQSPGFFSFLKYWKTSPPQFRVIVGGLLVFGLVNSSDLLLLLMLKNNGASDQHVILVYIGYNLVYALSSYPMGMLGDKIGLRRIFVLGLIFFAIVYTGVIFATTLPVMFLLFAIYGLYAAATEGISKAWISNLVPREETATAIGFLTGMNSICTLLASSLAGLIWFQLGPAYTFGFSAFATAVVILYFLSMPRLRKELNWSRQVTE